MVLSPPLVGGGCCFPPSVCFCFCNQYIDSTDVFFILQKCQNLHNIYMEKAPPKMSVRGEHSTISKAGAGESCTTPNEEEEGCTTLKGGGREAPPPNMSGRGEHSTISKAGGEECCTLQRRRGKAAPPEGRR